MKNGPPVEYRMLEAPGAMEELTALGPMKRFRVRVFGYRTVFEASCIIEYLGLHHPGPVRLLPEDGDAALEVRMLDRFFDNYVSTPQQKFVADRLRREAVRDPHGVAEARAMLETSYAWLDRHMQGREWAAGDRFTLADCGAAPFLFYADWTHAIDPAFANVVAYRRRLLARPSVVRAVDEARPFRKYFPLGAPDRD